MTAGEADEIVSRLAGALATADPAADPVRIGVGSFQPAVSKALTDAIERADDLGAVEATERVYDRLGGQNDPHVIRHATLTVSYGREIDAQWSRPATAIECSALLEPSAKSQSTSFTAAELPTS